MSDFLPWWVVITHFLNIFLLLLFHVVIHVLSLRYRRGTQKVLGPMVNPFERFFSRTFTSRQHVVCYAMDDKGLTEAEGRYGYFYGTIPLHLATNPQSLLALDMNGAPLPVEHGAPVRLRLETQLGFKMVKWITAIEFVDDITEIGMGMGGYREDQLYYANAAGI